MKGQLKLQLETEKLQSEKIYDIYKRIVREIERSTCIGRLMRLYRISSSEAEKYYIQLQKNHIVDQNGRVIKSTTEDATTSSK